MGHRFEAAMDSSVCNVRKNEKIEKQKLTSSTRSLERSIHHEDQRENDVLKFAKLLESSESSESMKALLLKILNSNKCEELKSFLNDKSTDMVRFRKKIGKANIDDSNIHDDRCKKQSSFRRLSKAGRSELLEQNTGSGHSLKSGTRKSTRTRVNDQGSRTNTTGAFTKLNSLPHSPGSLRRSRQSDSCLRKSNRDAVTVSPNQKSRLASSSSLLQLRTTRRSDINRRRPMVNLNQGDMQAEKQNSSWDPVPSGIILSKRGKSTGSFLKSATVSPGNKNASWGSNSAHTNGVDGVDKLRQKASRKSSEKRISPNQKKKNICDLRDGDGNSFTTEIKDSKLFNSFAQFEPTGQVAYCEQTVRLGDLVDNLRSNKDPIISNNEGNDETMPEKKGLRNYITRQLTKKVISRDKQSIAPESMNDNYASLPDENKFHVDGINAPIGSRSLQSSVAS